MGGIRWTAASSTPSPQRRAYLDAHSTANGHGVGDAYNLSGQKVGDNYRGIVIKNGRKMVRR